MTQANLRVIGTVTLIVAWPAQADERLSFDELMSRFGTDLDTATVSVESLDPGLHVLRAAGGAVVASIGDDGVMVVDDQYARTVDRLRAAIRELGGSEVDFVVNTHAHFDHAGGNPPLGAAGARIIAHENAQRQMTATVRLDYGDVHYLQTPLPAEGLPILSFGDSITLHFNNETIELRHFGRGHTDGDIAVFFSSADVVHMGDLYNARYPYLDVNGGGSLSGLIAVCRQVLDHVGSATRIVSGHAATASQADLLDYVSMLETVHTRLTGMAEDGMSTEEMLAARPTAEFDERRGNPSLFLTHAYRSVLTESE